MAERSKVSKKLIIEIIGNKEEINHYIIPCYQRGYRWTEKEVEKLLDDLYFSLTSEEKKYCLQPIVVKSVESNDKYITGTTRFGKEIEYKLKEWEVIDGQQRLTTIYLVLWILKKMHTDVEQIFTLEYENRENTTIALKKWVGNTDKPMPLINFNATEDGLDVYYLDKAVNKIIEWFDFGNGSKIEKPSQFCERIKHNVTMLWYEFDELDQNTTPVNMFCRLNMGKIPLTTSELLKAYILKINNASIEKERTELNINDRSIESVIKEKFISSQRAKASQWDLIEQALSEDDFFRFICASKTDFETRMDYLFQIKYIVDKLQSPLTMIETKIKIPSHEALFNYFEKMFTSSEYDPEDIWMDIRKTFLLFQEWYKDTITFHKIGFLIACSEDESAITLSKIKSLYDECESKEYFKNILLDEEIKRQVKYVLTTKDNNIINLDGLMYKENDKDNNNKIKIIILLFNIVSALKSSNYRFSFDKVFPLETNASLEHIFPQHPDIKDIKKEFEKSGSENDWFKRFGDIVLEECKKILECENNNSIFSDLSYEHIEIPSFPTDQDNTELEEWWSTVTSILYGSKDKIHQIGNLALISKNLNSELKNKMFSGKQEKIREYDKKGEYIPLCTHNAFLKYYSIRIEDQNISSNPTLAIWTQEDIDNHSIGLYDMIKDYLPDECKVENTYKSIISEEGVINV